MASPARSACPCVTSPVLADGYSQLSQSQRSALIKEAALYTAVRTGTQTRFASGADRVSYLKAATVAGSPKGPRPSQSAIIDALRLTCAP
jgi:hypothetical protein